MDRAQIHDLAKSMTAEDLAYFISCRSNSFSTDYRQGKVVGKFLQSDHRTLQATAFRYLLGIAVGIGEGQTYTDARNEQAVACAKEISKMIESGVLNIGFMV